MEELGSELDIYRCNIIGLSETRWNGNGEVITQNGHQCIYSGLDKKHMQGVAFLVNKELTNSIINKTIVFSRIISIGIQAIPFNCTLIQVYAPTTEYSEEEIEIFYEQIEDTIKQTPRTYLLIIMGDWNAKVGVDAHLTWPNAVGRFGNDITNERSERLLEFAD